MREYEAADLQRVQQLELMILEDFLALCRRHGLTCFGFAGTGIGAVRHKGFIPWACSGRITRPSSAMRSRSWGRSTSS